jgi:putative spermidine/putrescine transport system permease protein
MKKREFLTVFFLLLPVLIYFIFLFVYPFIYGLHLSLTNDEGKFTLANFIRFFTDPWDPLK